MKKKQYFEVLRPREIDQASFKYGIFVAAELASEYDTSSSHPYKLMDCIMAKLNMLPTSRIRKNKNAQRINNLIKDLEIRVAGVEGTMRFIVNGARRRATVKR